MMYDALFYNGQPVCDDYWDNTDATVACRELGFAGGVAVDGYTNYGTVPSDFSMDDVRCTGSETTLASCPHITTENCGSTEGAAIQCSTSGLMLRGTGATASEGNLFYNGEPVCDDYWDNTDAGVACRELGFSSGTATMRSQYGTVSSTFAMDDVRCTGSETSLQQ